MSNEKFTPGEWKMAMNKSRNGKGAIRGLSHCRIKNGKGVVVALAVPQKSRQEQIANTNLIAAAPEMYRVLSGICLEKSAQICKFAPESCEVCQIRKALKKARGEE